ncbi:hypothetical protein GCM10022403_097680 [Streptomyces coacervatus]|uniref:Uncharacterized protein n=1 Tax=Streptomyces coacervatus TaxID=647381 RepID=A0ABP7JQC6_9ACTN
MAGGRARHVTGVVVGVQGTPRGTGSLSTRRMANVVVAAVVNETDAMEAFAHAPHPLPDGWLPEGITIGSKPYAS